MGEIQASVIIPSLDRKEDLARCLDSLNRQTEQRFEVIILKERGPLAAIRNRGLQQARGKLVCFIDDDVICPQPWLSAVLDTFARTDLVGVTGPAIIPGTYRDRRDLFKYRRLSRCYEALFLGHDATRPGVITRAGAFTLAAAEADCHYEGPVDYLEACNMCFRTDALRAIGGFDEAYGGIGDWSEPDACYRLRQCGGQLWFTPWARLYHCPSIQGAFVLRRRTGSRLTNYHLFSKRWIKPHWRHTLYRGFLRSYYLQKDIRAWLSSHRPVTSS